MPKLDTYNRYLSNLNFLSRWLYLVNQVTGSLAIPVWQERDIEVPRWVTDCLGDAVGMLRECVEWWDKRRERDVEWEEKGIGELRMVLRVFEAVLRALVDSQEKRGGKGAATNVKETEENEIPPFPSTDTWAAIAVYCFLKDTTAIRLFIRSTWAEYARDRTSLQTASLVTNAAIAKLQPLSDQLRLAFPQFEHKNGIWLTMELLHFAEDRFCRLAWEEQRLCVDEPRAFEEAGAREVTGVVLNGAMLFFREGERGGESDEASAKPAPLPRAENTFVPHHRRARKYAL
jgi:hypothetical protein